MNRKWTGSGPAYELEWGGLNWTLRVDDPCPGLRATDPELGPLLGLEGVAEVGRWAHHALSGATLISQEQRLGRVEATYVPPSWGEMFVRAAWTPWNANGVDLEIEIRVRSVGELRDVEVKLLSTFGPPPSEGGSRSVEPRNAKCAGLTYDGRETDLAKLTTGPPDPHLGPWLAPQTGREGWTYLEMVHPGDFSRRIHEGRIPFQTTRYGLFGYDLERGVVLRGRLRGVWLRKSNAFSEAKRLYQEFLDEPPPLRT